MRRVKRSPKADEDLKKIARFIAADNPYAAERVMGRIRDAIEKLAYLPAARAGRVAGTFEKPVRGLPYIVAFELIGKDELHVLRVIHGARDWPTGTWPED